MLLCIIRTLYKEKILQVYLLPNFVFFFSSIICWRIGTSKRIDSVGIAAQIDECLLKEEEEKEKKVDGAKIK